MYIHRIHKASAIPIFPFPMCFFSRTLRKRGNDIFAAKPISDGEFKFPSEMTPISFSYWNEFVGYYVYYFGTKISSSASYTDNISLWILLSISEKWLITMIYFPSKRTASQDWQYFDCSRRLPIKCTVGFCLCGEILSWQFCQDNIFLPPVLRPALNTNLPKLFRFRPNGASHMCAIKLKLKRPSYLNIGSLDISSSLSMGVNSIPDWFHFPSPWRILNSLTTIYNWKNLKL